MPNDGMAELETEALCVRNCQQESLHIQNERSKMSTSSSKELHSNEAVLYENKLIEVNWTWGFFGIWGGFLVMPSSKWKSIASTLKENHAGVKSFFFKWASCSTRVAVAQGRSSNSEVGSLIPAPAVNMSNWPWEGFWTSNHCQWH